MKENMISIGQSVATGTVSVFVNKLKSIIVQSSYQCDLYCNLNFYTCATTSSSTTAGT